MHFKKIQYSIVLSVFCLLCMAQYIPSTINLMIKPEKADSKVCAAYSWDSPDDYNYNRGETPSHTITWTISNPEETYRSLYVYKAQYYPTSWLSFEYESLAGAYLISLVHSIVSNDNEIIVTYDVENTGYNTTYIISDQGTANDPLDIVKARLNDHPPTITQTPLNASFSLTLIDNAASIEIQWDIIDNISGTTTTYNITNSTDDIITSGTWTSPDTILWEFEFTIEGTYQYNFNVADVGTGWAYYITNSITIIVSSTPPPDDDDDDFSDELVYYDEDQLNETASVSKIFTYTILIIGGGLLIFGIYYGYMRSTCETSPNWTCKDPKKRIKQPKKPFS